MAVSFDKPLVLGFLPGFLLLVLLTKSKGFTFKKIAQISSHGVKRTSGVIWILFLVGFLLPSWYLAGTIEQMVSIALNLITLEHYFVTSFVISFIFSMILGTSVGTLSSIGIPIMGSALALNLPLEIVAGAIISGAFVGDRTSPFSSAHQLLAHTVEIQVKKQFYAMALTTIVAIVLGIGFYQYLDILLLSEIPIKHMAEIQAELNFSKFLPPFILILLVIFRVRIFYAFIASITSACMLALMNGVGVVKLLRALMYGIEGLGGGLNNMYLLLLFLGLAGAYNGLLEELKIVQNLLERWLHASNSLIADTIKTMLATFGITLIAANQTLPIILTGRSFLSHWSTRYSNAELARVMADSTMLFPGIVPWSVLTIMCSTIVGVSILDYFQYAIFLWVLPLLTIGVSIVKSVSRKKLLAQ